MARMQSGGPEEAGYEQGNSIGFPCEVMCLGAGRDPAGGRSGPHRDDPDLFIAKEGDSRPIRGPDRVYIRHLPVGEAPRLTGWKPGSERENPDVILPGAVRNKGQSLPIGSIGRVKVLRGAVDENTGDPPLNGIPQISR